MSDLAVAIRLSVCVALAAAVVAMLVGVPLAYVMRHRFAGRSLIEAIVIVPLVLPPTVLGYLVIVLLGRNGLAGRWLAGASGGYSILFRPEGAVLAAAIVALPLVYLPARSAFTSIDRDLDDIARLLGAGRLTIFWHIALPLGRRGIASGLLLAFARALGEFGATVMVLGDLPGRQTLPILIYDQYLSGAGPAVNAAVGLLCGISLVTVLIYNRLPEMGQG